MNRVQWKSRRNFGFLVVILLYLTLRVKNYGYRANVFLDKVDPKVVWEFVADFSNMRYLNPTIVDFTIVEESGNYDHWKYSIKYTENLSHWPHSINTALAHFNVKSDEKYGHYLVHSTHRTCFLLGMYCLDSESNFKFKKHLSTNGAICEEEIVYQCPAIFSMFCEREVAFQRNAIMYNLKRKFVK